jgi:3-oxoacyl-[acyl-carrier protein] reductase
VENWKEKNVLVTGGGRGIGKRLSMGFAQLGARVGLLARTKPELDLTHLEIEHAGGTSLRLRADVRDFEQLVAAIDRMRQRFGSIHVLICAAAVQGPIGPLYQATPQKWAETIETNLIGVMYSCRAVLPLMMEQRSGKIIVLSGNGAAQPRSFFSAYAASNAATARMVETLAAEVSEHNIQVNCMSPGGTYTSMTDEILGAGEAAGDKEHEEAMQIRRTGGVSPEMQMQLAQFLASEASNHVTGKLVHVKDDWKRLQDAAPRPELYTLRRVQGSR